MKKFLATLTLVLLVSSINAATAIADTTCETIGATANDRLFGDNFNNVDVRAYATHFTASASESISGGSALMYTAGSPTYDLKVRIFSDSAGTPGSDLGSIGTVNHTTVSNTKSWTNFTTGTPVSLTSGTAYWVVMYAGASFSDASAEDNVNYYLWELATGGITNASYRYLSGGWSSEGSNIALTTLTCSGGAASVSPATLPVFRFFWW